MLPQPPVQIGNVESSEATSQTEQLADENGFETLMRGPLHEAFAEPLGTGSAPVLIVPREPPQPIQEQAPEFRPDGDDAIWVPGYWGWDEERQDFIWVSGVYRVPPVGHRWVPGYWHITNSGWQWVQGFWVEETIDTVEYLPEPPTSLEIGPSSPSPGNDYFYIPGYWSNASSGYQWNVGYWYPLQEDNVWVPSHYVWTPRGCVFVRGYWDRRLPLRGLCFAPVYFPAQTISRVGWHYRPSVVLNTHVVLHNLFVHPGYCHYLFGDYYGLPAARRSVMPAYVYHQQRGNCDPLISFYTAYNARRGQDMLGWYHQRHNDLHRNPDLRPPHSWSKLASQSSSSSLDASSIAHRLEHLQRTPGELRIAPISAERKQESLRATELTHRLARDRASLEQMPKLGAETKQRPSEIPNRNDLPKLSLPKLETKSKSEIVTNKLPDLPTKGMSDRHSLKLGNTLRGQSNGLSNSPNTEQRNNLQSGMEIERRLRDAVRSGLSNPKSSGVDAATSKATGNTPLSPNPILVPTPNATQSTSRVFNPQSNGVKPRELKSIPGLSNPPAVKSNTPTRPSPQLNEPGVQGQNGRNGIPSVGMAETNRNSTPFNAPTQRNFGTNPSESKSNRRLTDPSLKLNGTPTINPPSPQSRSELKSIPQTNFNPPSPPSLRLDSLRPANGPTGIPQPKGLSNSDSRGAFKNEIQRGSQRPVVPDMSKSIPNSNKSSQSLNPGGSGRSSDVRSHGGGNSKGGPNGRK